MVEWFGKGVGPSTSGFLAWAVIRGVAKVVADIRIHSRPRVVEGVVYPSGVKLSEHDVTRADRSSWAAPVFALAGQATMAASYAALVTVYY